MAANYIAYSGNWITCGSYALIHAADLCYSDLIPLENSTGASFGIRCAGEDYGGTRMLSVFRDFNYGIDAAAPLWGIQLKRVDGETKDSIAALLQDSGIERVVIGPVSMVTLAYLPLSQQYRYVDHFIACIRQNGNLWKLIDSEGIPGLLIDSEEIIKMLTIQNIPEACGKYTARAVLHVNMRTAIQDRAIRIRYTLNTAYRNLKDAQENGQGFRAIYKCAELVFNMPSEKRKSLLYDIDYLIQRKLMLLKLLQDAERENVAIVNPNLITTIYQFIESAGMLRDNLQQQFFDRLAKAEKNITEKWKEWINYGSN